MPYNNDAEKKLSDYANLKAWYLLGFFLIEKTYVVFFQKIILLLRYFKY